MIMLPTQPQPQSKAETDLLDHYYRRGKAHLLELYKKPQTRK